MKLCTKCELCETSICNNLEGKQGKNAKLAIILDYPNLDENRKDKMGYGKTYELLRWNLKRMSIDLDSIYITYALKCYKPKNKLKKKPERLQAIKECRSNERIPDSCSVIFTVGSIACESYVRGKQLAAVEGTRIRGERTTFVAYSLGYCLKKPKETARFYRLLWTACLAAGLEPKYNPDLAPFDYEL